LATVSTVKFTTTLEAKPASNAETAMYTSGKPSGIGKTMTPPLVLVFLMEASVHEQQIRSPGWHCSSWLTKSDLLKKTATQPFLKHKFYSLQQSPNLNRKRAANQQADG
jgi:hypothetical protein